MNTTGNERSVGRPTEDFARASDLFSKIRTLAANGTSAPSFVVQAFRAIATDLSAPFAMIRARVGARAVDDYWHCGPTDPAFWRSTVEAASDTAMARAAAVARLYRAKSGDATVALLACPLPDASGEVSGALSLVIECPDERRAHELLALVRGVTAMIPALAAGIAREAARDSQASGAGGAVVQSLALAGNSRNRMALAISLTNQLRSKIGCEQVALATVRRNRPRLLSISGFSEVNERSPGVQVILAAMCEALDLGRTVSAGRTSDGNDYALHRRWSTEADGAAVATIPLRSGDRVTALVALRHGPGRTFSDDDLKKIAEAAAPYAAALDLVHRATRTVRQHAVSSALDFAKDAFRPRGLARTVLLCLFVAAIGWFCFGTMRDHATVRCRVLSADSRHLAAPFDGVLREANHVAGDTLKAGDVVARFDVTALELELKRLDAEIRKATIEADAERARGNEAAAMLIEAQADVDRAARRATEWKVDHAVLRAPQDGVILSGDLRARVGESIASGTTLFEFAPTGSLRVEMAIPDRDAHRLAVGTPGEFAALGKPDVRVPIELAAIRASSELRDGENVFVAEADLPGDFAWLRVGAEGFARLDAGDAPVWKAWLRRAIDFVRIKLWV